MSDAVVKKVAKEQTTDLAPPVASVARAALVIKYCRGRLGGSAFLLSVIQRAKASGRKVVVIDGDEASKTLREYYPEGDDAALVPSGTSNADFDKLMMEQLKQMAGDGISRVVDISGGSRDLDDVLTDLDLSVFCEDNNIDLVVVAMLGSFTTDLNHVVKATDGGHLKPRNLLLVLNRGVLGKLNSDVAFLPIMDDPRFKKLKAAGAAVITMPNLPALGAMMEDHADLYQVALTARWNGKFEPIWHNMSKRFVSEIEKEYALGGVLERLP